MRLVYATDSSPAALATAGILAELPFEATDTVVLLTVTGEHGITGAVQDASAEALRCSTASIRREMRRGHPVEEILRAAAEHPTDLVVVGSHGRSGVARLLLGSVAERVAREAPCSVLVTRPPARPFRRVVVGIDGSGPEELARSEQVVAWLRAFPLPAGCEVRLVTVLPNFHDPARAMLTPPLAGNVMQLAGQEREQAHDQLDRLTQLLADNERPVVAEIRSGDPVVALAAVAEDEGADLIVVGTSDPRGLERALLGSVAEGVLRSAPCSVLVVRSIR
jgi:nucleotide-binding universal stress UspA family protein